MYPGKNIQNLNLRREFNRRLKFVKSRIVEVMVEFHHFQGTLENLPDGMPVPPQWVRDAAECYRDKGMEKAFGHLTKEEIRKNPRAALREITAIYEGMVSYVHNPVSDPKLPAEANEAMAELCKTARLVVAKKFVTQLRKLSQKFDDLLGPATPQQLLENGARYQRGLMATLGADGKPFPDQTNTAQIFYALWFFWPMLIKRPKLTADDLHKWLGGELNLHVSFKLVQSIHTQLKLASRFRPITGAT